MSNQPIYANVCDTCNLAFAPELLKIYGRYCSGKCNRVAIELELQIIVETECWVKEYLERFYTPAGKL